MVPVIENLFIQFPEGAYYLLSQVGKLLKGIKNKVLDTCLAVARFYKSGFCHGDARFQNLIKVNFQFLWIDLMSYKAESTPNWLKDFEFFIISFFRRKIIVCFLFYYIVLDHFLKNLWFRKIFKVKSLAIGKKKKWSYLIWFYFLNHMSQSDN